MPFEPWLKQPEQNIVDPPDNPNNTDHMTTKPKDWFMDHLTTPAETEQIEEEGDRG